MLHVSEAPTHNRTPYVVSDSDKVPMKQKLAYGLGSVPDLWATWLYPGLASHVFTIFLHVSPALVSTALLINRLIDGVTDPLFGWLSDNTRSKWGRRRPYLLIFSIIGGLGLPMLFWVGPDWSEMSYFWFIVISYGLYIGLMSGYSTPFNSLGAELTPDYHERTSVMSIRQAMQRPFEVALFFAAAFTTLSWFNDPETGQPNILLGAQVYCTVLGGIIIIAGIVVFSVMRERYYDKVAVRQGKVSIIDAFGGTLRCRPFRSQLAMALVYGLGTSMVGTLGYFATVYYVCGGNVAAGARWNFFMGLSNMGLGLAGIATFSALGRRYGKRTAMGCMQLSAIAVFIGTWWLYTPAVPWLQMVASGLIAFTGAGFWTLWSSMGADVIDYDELETGQRREGAFKACESWIMKLGLALGIGASGYILSGTGFDSRLEGAQTENALLNIRFYLAVIPVAGLLLAMGALARFGLTEQRMLEIRAQLEARRGAI